MEKDVKVYTAEVNGVKIEVKGDYQKFMQLIKEAEKKKDQTYLKG
jgi:hypothetical protein